jgi:hypothetical protein
MKSANSRVIDACEKHWDAHNDDCSGFVKAVAQELGFILKGDANEIYTQMLRSPWKPLGGSGVEAERQSQMGFVLAALRDRGRSDSGEDNHGHVVVVVPGSLAHGKYPHAYWGKLFGVGKKNETLNFAFLKKNRDRDRVFYAWRQL